MHDKKRRDYLEWTLLQLSNSGPIIADFTSNEEFITRLLVYSQQLLMRDDTVSETVWKVLVLSCKNNGLDLANDI